MRQHAMLIACWSALLSSAAVCSVVHADAPAPNAPAKTYGYAIVVSEATLADPEWHKVVEALRVKHAAQVVTFSSSVKGSRGPLAEIMPRYTCFVAKPQEIGRGFVADVHRLTRALDEDVYTDTLWGILTGLNADDAMSVVTTTEPLVIRSVVSTTGVNDSIFDEVFTVSDGDEGAWLHRTPDGKRQTGGTDTPVLRKSDRSAMFAKHFAAIKPDALVSSSHGFENGIEMPWGHGMLMGRKGSLVALEMPSKKATKIEPQTNSKVFLPIGNCLTGRIDKDHASDSLILALQRSAGVKQSVAYTVETWFGRAGWGTLGLLQGCDARHNVAEAFFFNHQLLLREIHDRFPKVESFWPDWHTLDFKTFFPAGQKAGLDANNKDMMGLAYDRDTVAFYGDPAWDARLDVAKFPRGVKTDVTVKGNEFTLTIRCADAEAMSKLGSPICAMLPRRGVNPKVIEGQERGAIITDNFVMVTKPGVGAKGAEVVVKWTADIAE